MAAESRFQLADSFSSFLWLSRVRRWNFARRLFSLSFHSEAIQPSCSSLCKAREGDPSLTCGLSRRKSVSVAARLPSRGAVPAPESSESTSLECLGLNLRVCSSPFLSSLVTELRVPPLHSINKGSAERGRPRAVGSKYQNLATKVAATVLKSVSDI
jgi:hypothetical protein